MIRSTLKAALPLALLVIADELRPTSVAAQQAPVAPDPAQQQWRRELLRLGSQQEAYFAGSRGHYAAALSMLRFVATAGLTVTIVHADANSWAATVITTADPSRGCVAWYGRSLNRPATTPGGLPTGAAGEVVCDP